MTTAMRRYTAIFRLYFQESIVYPVQMLLWVLTDAWATVTMPLVFAAGSSNGMVAGTTVGNITLYYLVMLCLSTFVTCHFMWEVAWEIKEGTFTAHLVRPVSYLGVMLVRNLTWRILRLALTIPIAAVLIIFYWSTVQSTHLFFGWQLFASVVLGHLVSFMFVMAFAMLALFVQETQSIFELYYFPMLFLSGQMFPVHFLPGWVQGLAKVLPFYYTTGVPADIAVGKLSGATALAGLGGQVVWLALSYVSFRLLWKHGRKHYTAVGM